MKHQALFSSKDKSKKNKMSSAAFFSFSFFFFFLGGGGALRVKFNLTLLQLKTDKSFTTVMFYSFLFYPITLEGRRGTTDEFATIPFHLDLFSAALVELAKSIPVHSLILSSHLFFCLPLFLFPFTVS